MSRQDKPSGQEWALVGLRLGIALASIFLAWGLSGNVPQNFDSLLFPAILIVGCAVILMVAFFIPA